MLHVPTRRFRRRAQDLENESLEQEQFNGSAPSYMKVLFRKEQDALRAMEEAENGGAAAKPAPKKTKVKKKKAEKEVVAEA